MRFLGIDYGTRRIGIAISDEGGSLAFPKETISTDERVLEKIESIIKEEDITEIIVGESVNQDGLQNKVAKEVENFVRELEKFNLPIKLQKEFFTTIEARRYSGEKTEVDSSAAALILQRYLDKKKLAK